MSRQPAGTPSEDRRGWWSRPFEHGIFADSDVPRWAVLVIAIAFGVVEASLLWLLPLVGVHWFYDHWKVGGVVPALAVVLIGAWWADRRWPNLGDDI